jgi:hypothetical protein
MAMKSAFKWIGLDCVTAEETCPDCGCCIPSGLIHLCTAMEPAKQFSYKVTGGSGYVVYRDGIKLEPWDLVDMLNDWWD